MILPSFMATVLHGNDFIAVIQGLIDIVQYHHDSDTKLAVQLSDQLQYLQLIADIQIRGRLVKKQNFCTLRQRHGYPHALLLSA